VCADPDMPSIGTVYNWLRAHPEFLADYRRARALGFEFILMTQAERAPWLGSEARSMRALARVVKAARRRCAQIAPKQFADGVYAPFGEVEEE
jgi:hypothetical protein